MTFEGVQIGKRVWQGLGAGGALAASIVACQEIGGVSQHPKYVVKQEIACVPTLDRAPDPRAVEVMVRGAKVTLDLQQILNNASEGSVRLDANPVYSAAVIRDRNRNGSTLHVVLYRTGTTDALAMLQVTRTCVPGNVSGQWSIPQAR